VCVCACVCVCDDWLNLPLSRVPDAPIWAAALVVLKPCMLTC